MNKTYEVYYFSPDNPQHLEQWLEGILQTTGLRLLDSSGNYWIFEQTLLLDEPAKVGSLYSGAMESYGEFYDKAVVALGFSSASLPCQEMDDMMLDKISNSLSLVKDMAYALKFVYTRLPPHWRSECPFSYSEIMNRAKNVQRYGQIVS